MIFKQSRRAEKVFNRNWSNNYGIITYNDLWKVHLPNLSHNLQHMDHMELKLPHKILRHLKNQSELERESFPKGAKFSISSN